MPTATIKLFLPFGDGKRLRTAEISNWSGKALAAPRTDFVEFLSREEMTGSGIYLLIGNDPSTGKPTTYIGEAEVLCDRVKTHKAKEFWFSVIAFVSKDENLTKSHIRYLEGRLIELAESAGRCALDNSVSSGARLPEADRHDMEEFIEKIMQLLPVLGCDVLTPVGGSSPNNELVFTTEIKGLTGRGRRGPEGFIVLAGSQAVLELRGACPPATKAKRDGLLADGTLAKQDDKLVFTRDVEFSSPSAAATMIHGGNVSGPFVWKNSAGVSLGEVEKSDAGC